MGNEGRNKQLACSRQLLTAVIRALCVCVRFIVYLLLTLSSHYADLSICLSDSDGSFLCIELADQLPEYIKPESSMHRVWIRRGQVHLIPVPQTPAQLATLPARPTIEHALRLLNGQAVRTAASAEVQSALLLKLRPFFLAASAASPSFALSSPSLSASHYARVALPLSLALLLARYPQLLSEWANNFFYRDAIDMKRGNKMERILGGGGRKKKEAVAEAGRASEDSKMSDESIPAASSSSAPSSSSSAPDSPSIVPFVFLRVRFTHCLYAQMIHQRFAAPRAFQRHLSALTSSNTLGSSAAASPLLARAIDLGVKLATGAEMWYANQKSEHTKRSNKVKAARQKLGAQHPNVHRREEAVRLATTALSMQFNSADQLEAFIGTAVTSDPAASVLDQWRTFSAAVDTRQVAALFNAHSSSPMPACSSPLFCRSLLSAFLYLRYQPHHCVDFESVDELLRDPAQLSLFDPSGRDPHAQERRVDGCSNTPYVARVLELLDQLADACDTEAVEPAASSSAIAVPAALPASFAGLASTLLSSSFSSLPRDESDEWLTLSPAELESMLAKAASAASAAGAGSSAGAADVQMDRGGGGEYDGAAIVDSMHRFVGKLSEVEGVEAPSAKAGPSTAKSNSAAKAVSFNPETTRAAPTNKQTPSSSAAAAPALRPLNVNSDELMRLLSSFPADGAAFVFPATGSSYSSFNQTLLASSGQSAQLASQLPASDSDSDSEGKRSSKAPLGSSKSRPSVADESDEDIDPYDVAPSRLNTRPPVNDAYSAAFHTDTSSTPSAGAPIPGATPPQPTSTQQPQPTPASTSSSAPPSSSPKLRDYMAAMDDELQQAGVSESARTTCAHAQAQRVVL